MPMNRTPFGKMPFDRIAGIIDFIEVSDTITISLHEEILSLDNFQDLLYITLEENFTIQANLVSTDTLNIAVYDHYLRQVFEDINIYIEDEVKEVEYFIHANDSIVLGLDEILSDILVEYYRIDDLLLILDSFSYVFLFADKQKFIDGIIHNEFTIEGDIKNAFLIRGDYKLAMTNQNVEMWAGEAINIIIRADLPIEYTDIKWRLLDSRDSTDPIVEKSLLSTPFGMEINEDGNLVVSLEYEDTYELGGERYFHELRIWQSAQPNTVATGRLRINPSTFVVGQYGLNGE